MFCTWQEAMGPDIYPLCGWGLPGKYLFFLQKNVYAEERFHAPRFWVFLDLGILPLILVSADCSGFPTLKKKKKRKERKRG